jgi:hypothetical protein
VSAASKASPAKKGLVDLDQWWRNDLAAAIKARHPAYITRAELSRLMKWKLTRGKMRPLQKLVDSNDEGDVQTLSTHAFQNASACSELHMCIYFGQTDTALYQARKDPDQAVLKLSGKTFQHHLKYRSR